MCVYGTTTLFNPAIFFIGEGQDVKTVTFKQLRENVNVLASALRNLGIKNGDRVVGMFEFHFITSFR